MTEAHMERLLTQVQQTCSPPPTAQCNKKKKKKKKETEKKKCPVDPATPVSLGHCAEFCKAQFVFWWCTVKVCSQGLKGDPDVHAGSASVRKSNSCSSVHQLYNVTILTSNEARSCRTSQNRLHGIMDSPNIDDSDVRDVGHLEPVLHSTEGPFWGIRRVSLWEPWRLELTVFPPLAWRRQTHSCSITSGMSAVK